MSRSSRMRCQILKKELLAHGKFCWAIFNSMPAGSHETGWRARFNFDVIWEKFLC